MRKFVGQRIPEKEIANFKFVEGTYRNYMFFFDTKERSIRDIEVPFLLLKFTFVELTIGCSMIVKRYLSKETAEPPTSI
jgi:hypothetical protein